MSIAWYWPDWGACSDPPEESCSDAGCPVHGDDATSALDDDDDLPSTVEDIVAASIEQQSRRGG